MSTGMQYTAMAKQAMRLSRKTAAELGQPYIGTEHILAGLCREPDGVASHVLGMAGIGADQVMDYLHELFSEQVPVQAKVEGYTPRAQQLLAAAEREAQRFGADAVGTEHLLLALLKDTESVASQMLQVLDAPIQKIYAAVLVSMGHGDAVSTDEFLIAQRGRKRGARLSMLERFSKDLTQLAREGELDPVVGREEEMLRMVQILGRKTKNNPCLIGEPGVGKTAIVEALAQKIADGNVPACMEDKRILTLDLSGMVAGTKYRGEFEERIKRVIDEVTGSGDVILFIDEIHTVIGAGGAEGAIDAANILKPSLARGQLQLIGATTLEEYRKYIEKDAALERRFQPVTVEEPNEEQTLAILRGLKGRYEAHHQVEITDAALARAVYLSKRYITDRFLPDKAIDLMDEAMARARLTGQTTPPALVKQEEVVRTLVEKKEAALAEEDFVQAAAYGQEQAAAEEKLKKSRQRYRYANRSRRVVVDEEQIADVVCKWTKIPVKKLEQAESKKLLHLTETLKKRVVGQEEAVEAVSRAVKRGRVGLKSPDRPTGSFLFLGPTGVGKTELAKALAEAVFGSEESLIRVDMSEYMEKHSVSKLIGAPPGYVGYNEGGQVSEKVRRNPYSVILFDEVEKAHPDVFNVLLQVLDDGHITDAQGRKVDFKNTIMIMTSNLGAQSIVSPKRLGFAADASPEADYEKMKSGVMEEVRRLFRPEFLNRIDEMLVFHALTKEEMKQIAVIQLKELRTRCKTQMGIALSVRADARALLIEKGYDEKYGARPLRRCIQSMLEDGLVDEILSGRVQEGDSVTAYVHDGAIRFSVKGAEKQK